MWYPRTVRELLPHVQEGPHHGGLLLLMSACYRIAVVEELAIGRIESAWAPLYSQPKCPRFQNVDPALASSAEALGARLEV